MNMNDFSRVLIFEHALFASSTTRFSALVESYAYENKRIFRSSKNTIQRYELAASSTTNFSALVESYAYEINRIFPLFEKYDP